MPCYRPLKGFIIPSKLNDKGYEIKVQGYDVPSMRRHDNGNWYPSADLVGDGNRVISEFIDIPCGNCIGCRLEYSRQWADRCIMELQEHKSAYFLTLTYDDAHLPYKEMLTPTGEIIPTPDYGRSAFKPVPHLDEETGELHTCATLHKRDIQLFHKRLRERTGQKIRYFTAGEYGDSTKRPHYHSIEFGLEIPDLKLYKVCDGYNLYTSEFLNEIWQNGYVVVGDCTWDTCAYTARYVIKKAKGSTKEVYDALNINPEFVCMSRRPGIGRTFFEKNGKELFHFRSRPVTDSSGSVMVSSTNRYFDRLMSERDPDYMNDIKKKRIESAKHTEILRSAQTSMNKLDRLLAEEENVIAKTNSLLRVDN